MTLRSHTWPALVALILFVVSALGFYRFAPTSLWIEYESVEFAKVQDRPGALVFVSTARINYGWFYKWDDQLWCPSVDADEPYSSQPFPVWRDARGWKSSRWVYAKPYPPNTECYLQPRLTIEIFGAIHRHVAIPPTATFITPPDNG